MTPRRAQRGALRGQRAPPDKAHTLCIISCTSHNLPAIVASVGEDANRHRKRDSMNIVGKLATVSMDHCYFPGATARILEVTHRGAKMMLEGRTATVRLSDLDIHNA